MKTAIVIVNYNDYLSTNKLINNIKNYKIIDEIVVVDNHSNDDSINSIEKSVTLLKTNSNKGYAYALNVGCKYLIDKYNECNIIISNPDIIVEKEEDIKTLLSRINNENVIVGPTITENNSLNRGWKIPTFKDELLMNFNKKYKKRILYSDENYKNDTTLVEVVSGSFFIINSNHLKDINYFDENTFLYYEENIVGVKTKELHKKVLVDNTVKVIHNHSITIDKNINYINKLKILKQSQNYFCKKYTNSNKFQLWLLKVTSFITRTLIRIKHIF